MSFKEKTGKKVVLVGTYRAGQLERWPGYYNYPLNADDTVDAGAAKRVDEIWLFNGAAEEEIPGSFICRKRIANFGSGPCPNRMAGGE